MANYLILQYSQFILGGVETYYYRMMQWAVNNNMMPLVIIDEDAPFDNIWKDRLQELKTDLYYAKGAYPFYVFHTKDGKRLDLSDCQMVWSISGKLEGYVRGEAIRKQFHIHNFKNLLYVFSPFDIMATKLPLSRRLEEKMISHLLESKSLIFMDEETRNVAENEYKSLACSKAAIIRLGYQVGDETAIPSIDKKYENAKRTIVTIARFQFPFKIYVLGLIDVFAKLILKYPDLNLIIIGKGEGKAQVVDHLNHLNANIRERISFIEGVNYEEINTYIDCAYINVGMGTTILDFANRSVPSIVSIACERGDISYGVWSDNWNILGGLLQDDMAPASAMSTCLENVLSMSKKDYLETCMRHRELLKKHYSMEAVMLQLSQQGEGDAKPLPSVVLRCYSSYTHLKNRILEIVPKSIARTLSRYEA